MAHTFLDSSDRSWPVFVNVGALKRVRESCDFDLANALDGDSLQRLASDPVLLAEVLAAVCRPDIARVNISEEDFGDLLVGDVIESAVEALLQALADFFPDPKRTMVRTLLKKSKAYQSKMMPDLIRQIENLDLESMSGMSSGDSQPLLESTPQA